VFPLELTTRLLTRAGPPASMVVGQNSRFAFTGECSCWFHPTHPIVHHPFVCSGSLTQQISFESRPSGPRSPLPGIPPLMSKHQLLRRRRGYRLDTLNTYSGGTRRSGVRTRKDFEMEINGGSAYFAEGVDYVYVGLHRVLGTTVEVVMVGLPPIFTFFISPRSLPSALLLCRTISFHLFQGTTEAHKVFHTHLLPYIPLRGTPQGVPNVHRSRATQLYKSMNGGIDLS